jgi:hypothetical protein
VSPSSTPPGSSVSFSANRQSARVRGGRLSGEIWPVILSASSRSGCSARSSCACSASQYGERFTALTATALGH